MSESQRESAALPQANVAPVPAGLNCGATQPVWVNLHTKAWHEPGDPYYGRTKNGAYMCASDAAAKGYHAAGAHHADTTAPVTGGKHHKRHNKNGNGMEGAPEATSTPY